MKERRSSKRVHATSEKGVRTHKRGGGAEAEAEARIKWSGVTPDNEEEMNRKRQILYPKAVWSETSPSDMIDR